MASRVPAVIRRIGHGGLGQTHHGFLDLLRQPCRSAAECRQGLTLFAVFQLRPGPSRQLAFLPALVQLEIGFSR